MSVRCGHSVFGDREHVRRRAEVSQACPAAPRVRYWDGGSAGAGHEGDAPTLPLYRSLTPFMTTSAPIDSLTCNAASRYPYMPMVRSLPPAWASAALTSQLVISKGCSRRLQPAAAARSSSLALLGSLFSG